MGERNFNIDFVELFANIIDGEFAEMVHHVPQSPGSPITADCSDYSFMRLRRI
jgi:hypothetical protein